jgi:hypothetical protein
VTRLSTGVSGITATSPALTVAPSTGRMLFSVFQDQGYGVYALDASRTQGEPVLLGVNIANAGVLPPGDTPGRATVTNYLRDPVTGLPTGDDFTYTPYHSTFSLDAVGQPTVGVSAGGPFGTGVAGGVSFLFGDQLSDRQIGVGVQANGTVQDIGAQLIYQNLKHRWNYGASVQHVPYLTGYLTASQVAPGLYQQNLYLQRIFIDEAGFSTAYPFSSTRRIELSLSATRLGFSTQVQRIIVDQAGQIYDQRIDDTTSRAPIYYGQASVALVGDASYSAFTGPIMGSRYRFEVTPTAGTLSFTTALADYRKYFFARPITFAFRGLHYGRYGKSADDSTTLYPLFLGEEQLMRGYSVGSFDQSECGSGSTQVVNACPAFDRLLGSKLAVASFEIRIPVFGVPEYGLFNVPFLPLTVSPFVDAGVAWTGSSSPRFSGSNTSTSNYRTPVVSTGVSARFNVLGYAILEAYVAHPFQRPGKSWLWGFQLVPGW